MKKETTTVSKTWPTKAAMEQVYAKNFWGGEVGSFYSGEGSHDHQLVDPYVEVVISFLKSLDKPVVVCDLGCGDFNIGKQLAPYTLKYHAVDIVEDPIAYNQKHYASDAIDFQCLDLAKDTLPHGDCAIIRQVLQHLSNDEVLAICSQLSNYKYVIVTEHLPQDNFIPNLDIISGQGIRLKKKSGVDLLATPFNLKVRDQKHLLTIPLKKNKGKIVTWLYEMF